MCIWLPHGPAQRTGAARPELDQRQALEELAAWCRQFSPLVGVEDSPDPECLFLDVTGLEHLFGNEASLGQRILDALDGRGLEVRMAIADTLGAAWAAAHFAACPGTRQSACGHGEAACGLARFPVDPKPLSRTRLVIVPPGQSQNALRPLPIEALRLPRDVVERLHSVGIQRIEQLEVLPRSDLALRFGPALVGRWDQATGRRSEPIPALPPVQVFRARQDLEYPTARREIVESVLQRLVGRLAEMLLGSGRGAVRVDCRLDCQQSGGHSPPYDLQESGGHSPPYEAAEFSIGLFRPSASPQHLLGLVQMRLERLRIAGPVTAVSVEAAATAPLQRRQEELFDLDGCGPRRWSRRLLAGLVDRLAGRLGYRAVLRPRLVPEAQPELAYRYDPLLSPSPPAPFPRRERGVLIESLSRKARQVGKRLTTGPHPGPLPKGEGIRGRGPGRLATAGDWPPRPLRLLGEPVPLSVVSLVPDGPPLRFSFRGQEHRITQVWGPERIEIGWWRGPMVARDYYRVETAAGQRYWLFRRLADGRWFLHGTFE